MYIVEFTLYIVECIFYDIGMTILPYVLRPIEKSNFKKLI